MNGKRLYGLRGAVGCMNDRADMARRVGELFDALVVGNGIDEADIVSVVFSVTPDLDAENPAAAPRKSGRGGALALFCVAEPMSAGSLPGLIRVLVHAYAPEGTRLRHPYLNGAEVLRPDRAEGNQS